MTSPILFVSPTHGALRHHVVLVVTPTAFALVYNFLVLLAVLKSYMDTRFISSISKLCLLYDIFVSSYFSNQIRFVISRLLVLSSTNSLSSFKILVGAPTGVALRHYIFLSLTESVLSRFLFLYFLSPRSFCSVTLSLLCFVVVTFV